MAEAQESRTTIPRASIEDPVHDTITESGDRTRITASSDVYPTGIQLALLLLAVFVTMFLVALVGPCGPQCMLRHSSIHPQPVH